jgi:membrane-associated phospholipid phosphatase
LGCQKASLARLVLSIPARKGIGQQEMWIFRVVATVAAALFTALTCAPAAAQMPAKVHPLRWDPSLDLTVTVGGAAVWVVSEVLKEGLAPSRCRWCNVDSVDAGARDTLVWRYPASADAISNVTGFVLAPVAAVGLPALAAAHDRALGNAPEDALLVAEAAVVAADVTQLTKVILGRERPFVHALPPDEKRRTTQPSDNNLSFFSGHTSEACALASASGTIATMRGYRWAPLVWTIGGGMAATTAYLRIAADKHWLTDVLVGLVVGGAIGFAVPYAFHSPVDTPPPTSASAAVRSPVVPAGAGITFGW